MSILLPLQLLPALLYGVALIPWRRTASGARAPALTGLPGLGLAAHALALTLPWSGEYFHYGFAKLLSATVWIGVLLLWIEGYRVAGVRRLLALALPVAIVASLIPFVVPGQMFRFDDPRPLFLPHLVAGTLAYGVMFLAALHGLLILAVDRRLHPAARARGGILMRLLAQPGGEPPPLLALERMLFGFITIGFLLLLLTTLTGVVFSEETFGRPLRLEHKTLFSLVATMVFGALLIGRRIRGWRGRTALRLAFGGFALLLLSYAGSRFVLEVLLNRI